MRGAWYNAAELLLNQKGGIKGLAVRDLDGNLPIHVAVMRENIELLVLLLEYNADPLIANACGVTALELCILDGSRGGVPTA